MRIPTALVLACSLATATSCRKDDASADPGSASDDGLIGLDVGSPSGKKKRPGNPVSVGCIQDPADPGCTDELGTTRSKSGELEFTGDTCRVNLCSGRGTCELDSDGFVACTCDEGATGSTCEKRKR